MKSVITANSMVAHVTMSSIGLLAVLSAMNISNCELNDRVYVCPLNTQLVSKTIFARRETNRHCGESTP